MIVSSSSPVAKIEPARSFTSKEILAPKVAAFSSRGPSIYNADVIKVPSVKSLLPCFLGSRHYEAVLLRSCFHNSLT
jgi:hypothetical protein